uniref:centromere protein K isoform X2 n=1 Tax=Monopterus albus TaxID=43700 RepID=UPI0009B4E202|nr:centromere protein K isoform X2 [Monopterus albus]
MDEVNPGSQAAAELSQAAQAELLDMCEDQFALLEEVQNEIVLREPEPCENPQEQSENQLIAAEAELKQWLTLEPDLLIGNSEILLQAAKEEMLKMCSDLEMIVSCCETKRDKLRETKELEQKWLEEKKQVLIAVNDHTERLHMEKEQLSEHSLLRDIKEKIAKMKAYQDKLMECLGDVLDKHLPLPQDRSTSNKKKKNAEPELNEDQVSLTEVLEVLL